MDTPDYWTSLPFDQQALLKEVYRQGWGLWWRFAENPEYRPRLAKMVTNAMLTHLIRRKTEALNRSIGLRRRIRH